MTQLGLGTHDLQHSRQTQQAATITQSMQLITLVLLS
jgi:hypothetical protein